MVGWFWMNCRLVGCSSLVGWFLVAWTVVVAWFWVGLLVCVMFGFGLLEGLGWHGG